MIYLKVYVNVKGKLESFYMDPAENYMKILEQAHRRFGSQAIADVKIIRNKTQGK
jgi:hypothetical protein